MPRKPISGLICGCGAALGRTNKKGLCHACAIKISLEKRKKASGRVCPECGTGLLPQNKIGYCNACAQKKGIYYQSSTKGLSSWRKAQKKIEGPPVIVTCHRTECRKRFYLEKGQQPGMAWCPDCRRRRDYRSFSQEITAHSRTRFKEKRL